MEKSGVRDQGVKYVWSAGYIKELRAGVQGTHAVQNTRLIPKSLLGCIKELGLYFEGMEAWKDLMLGSGVIRAECMGRLGRQG